MAFKDTRHKGFVSNYTGNGIHSFGAFQYFQINDPNGTLDPYTGQVKVLDIATKAGFYSSTDTGSNITEVVYDPYGLAISTNNATLNNITVWSANSILTQGRADSRYILDSTVSNVPMSYGNDILYGHYQTRGPAPGFPFVAGSLPTGSYGVVGVANATDPCTIEFMPGESFNLMRFRSYNKAITFGADGLIVETGTASWNWTANTVLTQGRGDARYLQTLPAATNSTLGGIIVGSGLSIANGTLSVSSGSSSVTAAKAIAYSMILGR